MPADSSYLQREHSWWIKIRCYMIEPMFTHFKKAFERFSIFIFFTMDFFRIFETGKVISLILKQWPQNRKSPVI